MLNSVSHPTQLFSTLVCCLFPLLSYCSSQSSISDRHDYRSICEAASLDLTNFKTNPQYTPILEHLDQEGGLKQYKVIEQHFPYILDNPQKLKSNDTIGNPKTYCYPRIGQISPSTLRYARIAGELRELFGNLNGIKVLEIGAGYGGQAVVLNKLFGIKHIQLIDLKEPLRLQSRYLSMHDVNHKTIQIDALNKVEDYDLLISNYAFSECDKEIQYEYLNRVIAKAKMGYMICNITSHLYNINSISQKQLLKHLKRLKFKAKIIDENPKTSANNYVVVFKRRGL